MSSPVAPHKRTRSEHLVSPTKRVKEESGGISDGGHWFISAGVSGQTTLKQSAG